MNNDKSIWRSLFLLIIGGIFFFSTFGTFWATVVNKPDEIRTQDAFGTVTAGDSFQLQLNYVLDCYAEEYWTKNGIKRSGMSTYYYLIPISTNGSDMKYITLSSSDGSDSTINKINDETLAYYFDNAAPPATSCTLTVVAQPTKAKINGYLKEWCDETQFFGAGVTNYDSYVLPYTLTYIDPDIMYIKLIVGAIAMIIGLFRIIPGISSLFSSPYKTVPETPYSNYTPSNSESITPSKPVVHADPFAPEETNTYSDPFAPEEDPWSTDNNTDIDSHKEQSSGSSGGLRLKQD